MKRVLIGDLCDFKYGKALKKENRNEGSIPVYGSNGIVGYHDKALVIKKTIVVGRKGSIGEVHIANVPSWPIDTTYYVEFKVRDISIEWFFRLLKTLHLNELNRSVAVPGLNRDDVYRIKINLPPPDDQIRIAKLLSCVDSMIAKRKESLRLLDELLKGIFLEMFDKFLKNKGNLKITTFDAIKEKGSGTFSNGPFGSDLLTKELNKTGGIPVIYIRDIKEGEFFWSSNVFVTKEKADSLPNCKIKINDILIAKVGDPPGMAAINEQFTEAIITQDVVRLRVNKIKANPKYVQYFLNSEYGKWIVKKITIKGTRSRFPLKAFKSLPIRLPSIRLQNKFASIAEKVESVKNSYRRSLSEIENLYGALSQKAFKGELDLSRITVEQTSEPTTDTKDSELEQQPISLPLLDHKVMADPVARENLLQQIFKDYFTEHPKRTGSFKDFWNSVEFSVSDYMDDESPPLDSADYDKFKTWLFDLLKSGRAEQRFNEEKNKMELRTKP
ncbi:MAG: restriction endonuclease subunit S [Desulfobacteraceae bacterium]|jgi:type I restriction enzyme S subunit